MNLIIWLGFILISLNFLIKGKLLSSLLVVNFSILLLPIIGDSIYYWDIFSVLIIIFTIPRIKIYISINNLVILTIFLIVITIGLFLNYEIIALKEFLRWIEIISVFFCIDRYYKERKIENNFENILGLLIIINLIVHFCQVINIPLAYSLKPSDNYGTIGGFFNDSSEIGPISLLSASFFHYRLNSNPTKNILNIYFFTSVILAIVSSNRTSLVILPIILFARIFKYKSYTIIPLTGFMSYIITVVLGYSKKNESLINLLFENPELIFSSVNTFTLRLTNWDTILNHFNNNCNQFFGCGLAYFDAKRDLYFSDIGMFSIDNAYIRILTSHGYIGTIIIIMISLYFLSRFKMPIFVLYFLLYGIMIEAVKSLPIFIFVSTIFIFNQNNKILNGPIKSELD